VSVIASLAKVDDFDFQAVAPLPELKDYTETLDHCYGVFSTHREQNPQDPNVLRWLLNILYDQIEVAAWTGDLNRALRFVTQCRGLTAQLGTIYQNEYLIEARLSMLAGAWADACEHFDHHIRMVENIMDPLSEQESGAYVLWQYGNYLIKAGQTSEAIRRFNSALTFPDDLVNHVWKPKIRAWLANRQEAT